MKYLLLIQNFAPELWEGLSEEEKAALYARAWVHLTQSSAEGWCLTLMEAAT